MDEVILVDKNNNQIGTEEKIKAHKEGKLHRAFSIFIFNNKKELLLQQRAKSKYHSNCLWSNSVCSHPRPNETYSEATHRRLKEELGFDCNLRKVSCFIYSTSFNNGLIENEYDCVFIGKYTNELIIPNKDEIMDYKWISVKELKEDLIRNPEIYSIWLGLALKEITDLDIENIIIE